jgi:hypothetical protein
LFIGTKIMRVISRTMVSNGFSQLFTRCLKRFDHFRLLNR